jgi:hypothetical protein
MIEDSKWFITFMSRGPLPRSNVQSVKAAALLFVYVIVLDRTIAVVSYVP